MVEIFNYLVSAIWSIIPYQGILMTILDEIPA